MKVIKRILITLLIIAIIAVIAVAGLYIYIRATFGIDIVKTANQLKTLFTSVDEQKLCPEALSESDMIEARDEINGSVENLITYSADDGYCVNLENVPGEMNCVIKLTDRQAGAFAQNLFYRQTEGNINSNGKTIEIELKQLEFSNITDESAQLNAVVKLDIKSVKADLNQFPVSFLKSYIPDCFYASSAVEIVKGESAFEYSVAHKAIKINDLSADDTEDLFNTMDKVLGLGSAKHLNEQIGGSFAGALIGSETQSGLAYSLKDTGATDYNFVEISGERYFAVLLGDMPLTSEHDLTHVALKPACTGEGVLEHWHCKTCNKNFADKYGLTEIADVHGSVPQHISVADHDELNHWQECSFCGEITVSRQPHGESEYIRSSSGHYKVCPDCKAEYARGAHVAGADCLICGFRADYAVKCASDYGYNYLGTLAGGNNYQQFYTRLDNVASAFHDDETQKGTEEEVSGNIYYIVDSIEYSDLGLSSNQASSVWATYRSDHPLYYWIASHVVYSRHELSLCVDESYRDGNARIAKNSAIYSVIDEYLDAVITQTSAYDIAYTLHNMIIQNIDYAYGKGGNPETASWAHSIDGVFTRGGSVCEGYAKAFSLLLNASGVENAYVTGTSNGEGHAWNIVKVDGNWYWYDLTWDDQPNMPNGIIYDYLCRCNSEFRDHTVDVQGDMNNPMAFLYVLPHAATSPYRP